VPKRHAPEIRAAAVAAVATGEQAAAVAKRFGISQGRLHEWCKVDGPDYSAIPEVSGSQYARTRERMAELIYDCIGDIFTTVRDQLRSASREEWVARQNAGDVAAILDREIDGAIRLLAGFRPVERPDDLDALDDVPPLGAPARPADDRADL
jgi:hypothetical protein